jgi:benzoate/toluate 1,2-dioxygenase subunit beta
VSPTAAGARLREVEAFLFHEADLLDEGRYLEWEALWADEAEYWVPAGQDDYDPRREVSIIYDDRRGIRARVERLTSGLAYTQEPRSDLGRVVANARLVAETDAHLDVLSSLLALEHRLWRWSEWAGRVEHRLRPLTDGFRIRRKKVVLSGADADLPMLQFLL